MPANSFECVSLPWRDSKSKVCYKARFQSLPTNQLRLGYRRPASLPGFLRSNEPRVREVRQNDFSALEMHCVKLIWRSLGKVTHIATRAFESDYASPPK